MCRYLVTFCISRKKFTSGPLTDEVVEVYQDNPDAIDIIRAVVDKLGDSYDPDCIVLVNYWKLNH